jgi:hypothetical protein
VEVKSSGERSTHHFSFTTFYFPYDRKGISMDFRPLNDSERRNLIEALRGNTDGNRVMLMDRRDTSFTGTVDEVTDDEVITAIKSVPVHY